MRSEKMRKVLSFLMALVLVAQNLPAAAFAAEDCAHHPEHTADCGYAEAVAGAPCTHVHDAACGYVEAVAGVKCACEATGEGGALVHTEGCGYVAPVTGADCTHVHDGACGYVAAVEGHECHYACAECANAFPSGEGGTAAAVTDEIVCICGTDDTTHATTCAVYVAPEDPVCYCAEKCTEPNQWCDICGFDISKCGGADSAAAYTETTTIYFNNTAGWEAVYAYTWNADGPTSGIWPGRAMTHVEGTVYSIEVPDGEENIIFNNGNGGDGNQTADLTIPTDGKNYYIFGSNAWTTYEGSSNPGGDEEPPEPETCDHSGDKLSYAENTIYTFMHDITCACGGYSATEPHTDTDGNNKCDVCGAALVARVKGSFAAGTSGSLAGDSTEGMKADQITGTRYYTNLRWALTEYFEEVTVLADVTIPAEQAAYVAPSNGRYNAEAENRPEKAVIDLGGHTVTVDTVLDFMVASSDPVTEVTLKNGTLKINLTMYIRQGVTLTNEATILLGENAGISNGGSATCLPDGSNHVWKNGRCALCGLGESDARLNGIRITGDTVAYNPDTNTYTVYFPAGAETVSYDAVFSGRNLANYRDASGLKWRETFERDGAVVSVDTSDLASYNYFSYNEDTGELIVTGTQTSAAIGLAVLYEFSNDGGATWVPACTQVFAACPHTSFENGICTLCGEPCQHSFDTTGKCSDCGAQAVAQVGDTFYMTLDEAISAVSGATAEDNATVKLLTECSESIEIREGVFTLDLNGKTLQTQKDTSAAMHITGGSVTVTGGTITASAAVITADGTDVTGNYNVSYASGQLVIQPDISKIDALTTENVTSANEADIEAVQEMLENVDSLAEE